VELIEVEVDPLSGPPRDGGGICPWKAIPKGAEYCGGCLRQLPAQCSKCVNSFSTSHSTRKRGQIVRYDCGAKNAYGVVKGRQIIRFETALASMCKAISGHSRNITFGELRSWPSMPPSSPVLAFQFSPMATWGLSNTRFTGRWGRHSSRSKDTLVLLCLDSKALWVGQRMGRRIKQTWGGWPCSAGRTWRIQRRVCQV